MIITLDSVQLDSITCYKCGVLFAIPKYLKQKLIESHDSFWCPNGHSQAFYGKTDYEVEKERNLALQATINQEKHARLVAEKERDANIRAITRLKRRAAAGVCPCCTRTFTNLANHMKTQHSDFMLEKRKELK